MANYEHLIGDPDDFQAAIEFWLCAYHERGEKIEKLEDELDILKVEFDELKEDYEQALEELQTYRYAAGVA